MTSVTDRLEDLDYFFAICAEQDATNARLTAAGFTGAAYDMPSQDWAAYVRGQRIGWHQAKPGAEAMVRDQVSRELGREVAAR